MERKRLVLDANILIRGCFGRRVRVVLAEHAEQADFFVAQATLSEAQRYVADLAADEHNFIIGPTALTLAEPGVYELVFEVHTRAEKLEHRYRSRLDRATDADA